MSAGTVLAGLIVSALGLVGLMQSYGYAILPFDLAVVDVYLTTLGALLLFGVITVIGLGLIMGGLATLGERDATAESQPTAVRGGSNLEPANPYAAVYAAPSQLDLSVLRLVSRGGTTKRWRT